VSDSSTVSDSSIAPSVSDADRRQLARVACLLRVVGIADCLAVVVAFLPWDIIAAMHSAIGAGELTREPTVEYLVRSVSLLHAIFGAMLVLLSADVTRYLDLIRGLAKLLCLAAILLAVVDQQSGVPLWWAIAQCGGLLGMGLFLSLSCRPLNNGPGSPSA